MSHYFHSIPGRLRVRSRAFRNRPQITRTARSLLGDLEGVRSVDANLTTGSLLIRYDERIVSSTQVLSALAAEGWIEQVPSPKPSLQMAAPKVAGSWRRLANGLSDALPDLIADVIADKLAQRAALVLVRAVI
jgi:copper chaperone CopZ